MSSSRSSNMLFMEQQRLLYRNSTGPILIFIIIATYLCWYMQNSTEDVILFAWLSTFSLVAFGRLCLTVKEWEDSNLLTKTQTIAVNISAREFSTPDFVDRIINKVKETGVNPQHIDIELTEGSLISSVSDTIKKIQALRDYGIKFSVDDFGTGYSSLSYLKSLPLHTLKIDRSFVNDISPSGNETTLVEIIITMARSLSLEIVAEGVETVEELNYLASKGCGVYQGYYFCKPPPIQEFRKMLEYGCVG